MDIGKLAAGQLTVRGAISHHGGLASHTSLVVDSVAIVFIHMCVDYVLSSCLYAYALLWLL